MAVFYRARGGERKCVLRTDFEIFLKKSRFVVYKEDKNVKKFSCHEKNLLRLHYSIIHGKKS